jgi:hypothetical protein
MLIRAFGRLPSQHTRIVSRNLRCPWQGPAARWMSSGPGAKEAQTLFAVRQTEPGRSPTTWHLQQDKASDSVSFVQPPSSQQGPWTLQRARQALEQTFMPSGYPHTVDPCFAAYCRVRACVRACVCIYIYVCVCVHAYMKMCVCVCVCVCVCFGYCKRDHLFYLTLSRSCSSCTWRQAAPQVCSPCR